MVQPTIKEEYSLTGFPQRRPYKLNWELTIGDVRKESHLRSFYFHKMREGSSDLGNFITTRFSCLTKWPFFKCQRRGISIGGEDKLNSRRFDIINFTLSTGHGKDAEFHQAYFYHGPGYAEYVLIASTKSLQDDKKLFPYELTQTRPISVSANKTKFPSPREVGRVFLSENQFYPATQASPPKKVIKVNGNFFVPFDFSQYTEKEEPVRELFRRFDRLYTYFKAEFRKRTFLATRPGIINELLWPRFKELIYFSLENKLIQFPELKITKPETNVT